MGRVCAAGYTHQLWRANSANAPSAFPRWCRGVYARPAALRRYCRYSGAVVSEHCHGKLLTGYDGRAYHLSCAISFSSATFMIVTEPYETSMTCAFRNSARTRLT